MRLLAVVHDSNKYGASRSFLEVINGLQEKSVDCFVIMPSEGPLTEELDDIGINYNFIPFKMWLSRSPVIWKRVVRSIYNLLISFWVAYIAWNLKADLIYSNTIMTPVGAIAAKMIGKPHIWQIREFAQEDYLLDFDLGIKFSHKLIDRLSFRVILVSYALMDKYSQYINSGKLTVIYNPVSAEYQPTGSKAFNQPTRSENVYPSVIIVGLIHLIKGQMDAVLALSELIKLNKLVKLVIVGDGDHRYISSLQRIIKQYKIDKYVEFTGYVDNPRILLESSDIVLVCSRSEAFGRVTVEGMISGKPIIGARSGATPELIIEGFNGLMYEPGNYVDLANKIKELVDDPDKAIVMGNNGKRLAIEKYSRDNCVAKIFDILKQAEC